MKKWTVVSARVPVEMRERLEEKALAEGFPNISDFLRSVLAERVESHVRESEPVDACRPQELGVEHDRTCPMLRFVDSERCVHCPFRKAAQVQEMGENAETAPSEYQRLSEGISRPPLRKEQG